MCVCSPDRVCVVEGEGLEEEGEEGRALEDSQTAVSVESQLTAGREINYN